MNEAPDSALIEQSRRGDPAAFRLLFERHWRAVYAVCHRLARDHGAAEDLTQEVFLVAHQRLASFRGEAQFGTWLYRIAVNQSLGWMRRRDRRREMFLEDAPPGTAEAGPAYRDGHAGPPDAELEERERMAALARAVDTLPPKQRVVFLLRTGEGLTFEAIAERVGRSIGGTKANFHLAVQNLRKQLRHLAADDATGR